MGKLIDMTGKRFGRWLVLARHPRAKRNEGTFWDCTCVCDEERVVDGNNLRRGISQSCGCLRREKSKQCHTTHGMSHTSIYERWKAMKQRCFNPRNKNYPDYSGRGIGIDDPDWCFDFQAYHADVGDPPPGLWLDRIDNNSGYSARNCAWVPPSVQVVNRRNKRRNGKTSNARRKRQ
jgi:hypothetical protein